MTTPLETLSKVLKEEMSLYQNFHELLEQEYEILQASQLEELQECNKLKQALSKMISEKERERVEICHEIAQKLGLQKESVSLRDLAKALGGQQEQNLLQIRKNFQNIVERLKEKNEVNSLMAESALDLVSGGIELVREALKLKETYGKKAKLAKQEQATHLLSKRA